MAGENQSGQAAVYNTSTTSTSTYWTGEATFVNDNGLVVGDTNTGFYYYGYVLRRWRKSAANRSISRPPMPQGA